MSSQCQSPVQSTTVFSGIRQYLHRLDRSTQFLLTLFIVLVLMHQAGIDKFGDDIYFTDYGSLPFLVLRYNWWTSRMLIESVLILFAYLPFIFFKIFNSLIIVSLPFLLARLTAPRMEAEKLLFPAICLVLMYPASGMHEAGWIATCANYLWPLAAALAAVLPIKRLHEGRAVSRREGIFYSFCMAFACNNELLCVTFLILIPLYAGFSLMSSRNWRSIPRLVAVYGIIAVLSVLFISLCPGNGLRYIAETMNWMPQFFSLTLIRKIYAGYMSFAVPFFFSSNFLLLALTIVLSVGIFQKYRETSFRILAIIPLFPHLLAMPQLASIAELSSSRVGHYGLLFVSCLILFALAMTIFLLADTWKDFLLIVTLPVVALAARMAISFSPTMFASGNRTAFFVYVSLAVTTLWAYLRIQDRIPPVMLTYCRLLLLALAFFCVLKG